MSSALEIARVTAVWALLVMGLLCWLMALAGVVGAGLGWDEMDEAGPVVGVLLLAGLFLLTGVILFS